MLIRDPLQTGNTPYDVLGLGLGDRETNLHAAFTAALARRRFSQAELTAARKRLADAVSRACVDAFLHAPSVAAETELVRLLAPPSRAATAEAWLTIARSAPARIEIVHSLALLWYWWAASAMTPDAGRAAGRPVPDLPDLWRKAIGCWAYLLASPRAWGQVTGLTQEADLDASREQVADRLERELLDAERVLDGDRSSGLTAGLHRELRVVRSMVDCGLPVLGAGTEGLGAGPLLLDELGSVAQVRERLAQLQARYPLFAMPLKDLDADLSGVDWVAALLAEQRWDDALEAIRSLPPGFQTSPAARDLQARARIGRGTEYWRAARLQDAMTEWLTAAAVPAETRTRAEAVRQVAQACEDAARFPDAQLGLASELVRMAVAVFPDDLRVTAARQQIGDRLAQRALRALEVVQSEVRALVGGSSGLLSLWERWGADWKARVDAAAADMDLAAQLCSPSAASLLVAAEGKRNELLAYFEHTIASRVLAAQATAAANAGEWSLAVDGLLDALRVAPEGERGALERTLARCWIAQARQLLQDPAVQAARRHSALTPPAVDAAVHCLRAALEALRSAQQLVPNDSRSGHLQRDALRLLVRLTDEGDRVAGEAHAGARTAQPAPDTGLCVFAGLALAAIGVVALAAPLSDNIWGVTLAILGCIALHYEARRARRSVLLVVTAVVLLTAFSFRLGMEAEGDLALIMLAAHVAAWVLGSRVREQVE